MNTFVNSINNAITANGCPAYNSTLNKCLDFFYRGGSLRGENDVFRTLFEEAYAEDKERALRILQWVRDARCGAGERGLFRETLVYFINSSSSDNLKFALIAKTPEIGRWDDLVYLLDKDVKAKYKKYIVHMIDDALNKTLVSLGKPSSYDAMCGKWLPRKGAVAMYLAKELGLTPREYRIKIVAATKVVETLMCKKEWGRINYRSVPSQAARIYQKAFLRNDKERYEEYLDAVRAGKDKINAGTLYPYQVLNSITYQDRNIETLWNALPNYIPEGVSILPVIDTSSSMCVKLHKSNRMAMEVAISMGLYIAEKSSGDFKDVWCTFSGHPQLCHVTGDINNKYRTVRLTSIVSNTDIEATHREILRHAMDNKVPKEDMPKYIVIFSDMQFDQGARFSETAHQTAVRMYAGAGYEIPKIIYWNLVGAYNNFPVNKSEMGVCLISGFSPVALKSVLNGDVFNPIQMMDNVIMVDRYNIFNLTGSEGPC